MTNEGAIRVLRYKSPAQRNMRANEMTSAEQAERNEALRVYAAMSGAEQQIAERNVRDEDAPRA